MKATLQSTRDRIANRLAKLPTTQEFNRTDTQRLANQTGNTFVIFFHNRMWNSWQKGLRDIPEDAQHVEEISPA